MARPPRDVFAAVVSFICRGYLLFAIMPVIYVEGMGVTRSSGPQNMERQQSPSILANAPATKPKRVWTNDDLTGSSVTTGATTQSARDPSDAAAFLKPHDGAVVQPGETLQIEILVTPGKVNGPVAIVSAIGDSNQVRESPPYSFTMNVPREDRAGAGAPLIGKHAITAFGKLSGQDEYDLASIDLDVEEREMPVKLSVAGNMLSQYGPPGASFFGASEQDFLAIRAKFPNGDDFDVTHSTYLQLVSGNPNVVMVDERGTLTSLGPGNTIVTATYTFGGRTLQLSLPVSVSVPQVGLIPNPLSLDFGNQPVGRESNPLRVVLTNRSNGMIQIYKPENRAAARESDDCTASQLPPGGSCTMSVTFFAIRPGRSQGFIFIPNSKSGQISLSVSGNGF